MFCKTKDNLDIYYEVQGNPGAQETIVFLNGLTQSTLSWLFVIPAFKKNYRILLLDFIFQGNSSKNSDVRNFDTHAADVVCVLDKENITNAHVVGLSYGSMVAQHLAINFPNRVNKLILLSTFAHKTPMFEMIETSWWNALEKGGYTLLFDTMMPFVLSEEYFNNPIVPITALKASKEELNHNTQSIFRLMEATRTRPDYRKELKKIKSPTLIIQGEKDLLLPVYFAEEVQKNIPGSKLIVIKRAGHTLNLEHVTEVCKHIIDFLTSS